MDKLVTNIVTKQRDLFLLSVVSGINNGVFVCVGDDNGDFTELVLSVNSTNAVFLLEHNDLYHSLKSKYNSRIITVMPDTFDFLHIDCESKTYDYAKGALDKYFPKVRENGFVMGSRIKDTIIQNAFSEFISKNCLTGAGAEERIFFKKTHNTKSATLPKKNIMFATKFSADGLSSNETLKQLLAIFSFQQDLIVFTDANLVADLSALNSKITFVDSNQVTNTLEKKYIQLGREIDPDAEYSEHNKINFLRHAKSVNPNYILYAWLDCTAEMSAIKFHNTNFPTNKLTFFSSASDSSTFVIPNSLMESVEVLYEYKLIEMQTRWIANQHIFAQMHQDFPGMFNLI